MDKITLEKAWLLDNKIKQCTEALDCFEWTSFDDTVHTRNPRIIIEVDGSDYDREEIMLPFELSQELIDLLKNHIKNERAALVKEFNEL